MIGESVVDGLKAEGYAVDWVQDGNSALIALRTTPFSLVILDLGLPGKDGISVLQEVRSRRIHTPVLVTTARDTISDRVKGLDAGADDYLIKPYDLDELSARIRALLRRAETYGTPTEQVVVYRVGGLEVSPSCHLVKVNGQDIALTLKEFELLCLLLENRGIVLSRDKILDKVWGDTMGRESRTVDVHIRTLRQKLGPCGERIETVRGIGYKFQGEA